LQQQYEYHDERKAADLYELNDCVQEAATRSDKLHVNDHTKHNGIDKSDKTSSNAVNRTSPAWTVISQLILSGSTSRLFLHYMCNQSQWRT